MSRRLVVTLAMLVLLVGVEAYIVRSGRLPPAEFSFSNETEIKSLDPAIVSGVPENRIMNAIHEGLVRLGARQEVLPGVAQRWDISDDGLTYTFHLRRDARWSNGDPVTAHDFAYSMRRVLDPVTASEYAYQAWYLVGAEDYTKPSQALAPGRPVEVQLHDPPENAARFARGEVLRGELISIEVDAGAGDKADEPREYFNTRTFVVETDGESRRFRVTSDQPPAGAAACSQILVDFSTVGYRAVDDYTIEMKLRNSTPYWLKLVGFYTLFPVHQATIEQHGAPQWTYPENIVTNGPYRVAFRRLRDRIRLVKNEHHWDRENVAIESIDALAVGSDITSFNLYETGQIDWVTKVEPLISKRLLVEDPPRPDFNPALMFTSYYYELSVNRPPLDDLRVRQALSMALDRDEIIRTACAGETPAMHLTPPGIPGYVSPKCRAENVEQARRLLAEAGYPDGKGFRKIEILYNVGYEGHKTIAELVRKQWQSNLGINVATRNEEWSTYNNSLRQHKFDVARRAWNGDYLDPNTFLDMFVTNGENNDPDYSNPQYDALIKAAQAEPDPEQRLETLRQAEALLMEELPILPIYFYVSRNLVRPRVRGLHNNALDQHPLWAMWLDDSPGVTNEFMSTAPAPEEPAR